MIDMECVQIETDRLCQASEQAKQRQRVRAARVANHHARRAHFPKANKGHAQPLHQSLLPRWRASGTIV
jgi:hypothetical protein